MAITVADNPLVHTFSVRGLGRLWVHALHFEAGPPGLARAAT